MTLGKLCCQQDKCFPLWKCLHTTASCPASFAFLKNLGVYLD